MEPKKKKKNFLESKKNQNEKYSWWCPVNEWNEWMFVHVKRKRANNNNNNCLRKNNEKVYPFYTLNVNVCFIFSFHFFFFLVVWLILFKFFFTCLSLPFSFSSIEKIFFEVCMGGSICFSPHSLHCVCKDFCWRAFKMFFLVFFEEEKKTRNLFFSNSTIGWLILGFGGKRRVEFFYFFFANSLKNKKQSFVYYIIIIICIRKNNNDSHHHHHHHFNFVARIFHLYTNTHTFVCDGFQFSSSSIMFPKYTILVHLEFFSLFLILFVVNYSIFFFFCKPSKIVPFILHFKHTDSILNEC